MTMAIPIPAAILFFCAATMTFMAVRRLRAGQRGRTLFNIIFLQLESFVDPTMVNDIKLNKDAINMLLGKR